MSTKKVLLASIVSGMLGLSSTATLATPSWFYFICESKIESGLFKINVEAENKTHAFQRLNTEPQYSNLRHCRSTTRDAVVPKR